MYIQEEYKEGNLTFIELRNKANSSWLKVVPERGGIITNLGLQGKELLFLNEATLHDKQKNIRGGIPILFPISGQLENGEYEWNGTTYKMKNHGFARDLPWQVKDIKTGSDEASITMKLESNSETLTSYPFQFTLIFKYILHNNKLTIEQEYQNHSKEEMPIYAGFHPYFKTTTKQLKIDTDATEYLDYNDMEFKKFSKVIDIDQKESYALKTKTGAFQFFLDDIGSSINLTYNPDFPYVVLWSEEGKDFVCVEPWMAKTDELNRKEELTRISPNESLQTSIAISI
ncbi:aldose epimerase [Neobacillus sp. PS3-34]|uniref:aldose epimerase family protein n=1 Tax=Neobacillus sp. PS3-34 TaxID=3070678 RepID=UPI0027E12F14|nr:aldose epimerase [Neobacillus sp. PS3-34]WML49026.1 aldose epimerase [Neobacillus sp. PS3-34]